MPIFVLDILAIIFCSIGLIFENNVGCFDIVLLMHTKSGIVIAFTDGCSAYPNCEFVEVGVNFLCEVLL